MFINASEDIDELTDTVSECQNFRKDNVVEKKTVTIYPNNKPWITSELKTVFNEIKACFREGDREKLKVVNKKLKREIRKTKDNYKDRIESYFKSNETSKVWKGMESVTGCEQKKINEITVVLVKNICLMNWTSFMLDLMIMIIQPNCGVLLIG
ncbi:hypothetical protein HOLleu_22021 [Holothuria leucospilota]|uniref:Uncharacterized protein n=1 Tax=Holothuria leucospilota TaxID=206669 RepID=A0A9Q1H782_HOLLE|nr:hypothetical protein HOLleu_22021 [Holothuria leucospilota]